MLLFPISSKGSFMTIITDRITHTSTFVTPVVENWLEWEITQWVHHEGSIWRPWANAFTTKLHQAPLTRPSEIYQKWRAGPDEGGDGLEVRGLQQHVQLLPPDRQHFVLERQLPRIQLENLANKYTFSVRNDSLRTWRINTRSVLGTTAWEPGE